MLKKHLLCSFLMFGTYGFAQNGVLVVDYDFHLNLGQDSHYNSKLILTPMENLFLWGKPTGPAIEEGEHELNINLSAFDSIGSFNYTIRSVDSMYSRIPLLDQKSLMVKESIPSISWAIGNQIKQIGPYNCQDAVGNFRGREYTVWFTYDIPISSGPWKLQGLPGLIVSASDASGEVHFIFKSITKTHERIEPDLYAGKTITVEDYAKEQNAIADDLIKKLKSKFPRGTNVTVPRRNSLELFDIKE